MQSLHARLKMKPQRGCKYGVPEHPILPPLDQCRLTDVMPCMDDRSIVCFLQQAMLTLASNMGQLYKVVVYFVTATS